MGKLTGKVAVITGGNSGIGLASAKLFVAEGAKVVLNGRRRDAVAQAVAEIGDDAVGIAGDVSSLEDLDRLYAEVGSRFGKIDVVFANAGVLNLAPFAAITPEQFDREFDVNVRGLFFSVQKALPLMADGGSIILTSSVAHASGFPNYSLYAGAKAAVRAFARGWTTDLKDRKIRVNTLSPGPTETPLAGKMGIPLEVLAQRLPELIAQIPLGRMAHADEIAKAALFLASDDSSFVTGIDLGVDGGLGQI